MRQALGKMREIELRGNFQGDISGIRQRQCPLHCIAVLLGIAIIHHKSVPVWLNQFVGTADGGGH